MSKNNIKTIILCLLLALAICGLTSCFGNKTPQRTYFSIDYTLNTQPKYDVPKYDATVVVQNITTALAYDRQEIVYRANPYEFQYYWYRLWASKPRKMLQELVSGHLKYTQIFNHVSTKIEDRLPDYTLNVEIMAIEELDMSQTEWYAHLALDFILSRTSDGLNVWTYSFDARRPVANNQPVYVVKAISELMDTELIKAFEDMDQKLAIVVDPSKQNLSAKIVNEIVSPIQTETVTQQPGQELETLQEPEGDKPRASLKNRR